MRTLACRFLVSSLLVAGGWSGVVRGAEIDDPTGTWSLTPFVARPGETGGEELAAVPGGVDPGRERFHAVMARDWPVGLVPVFAVERRGDYELRRLPPRGRENLVEPLFFGLAPVGEEPAGRLAGRWSCLAWHADGRRSDLGWDLAVAGEVVAGRFNQDTDYRFAYITEGWQGDDRVRLEVEYVQDRYTLEGGWEGDRLRGSWRHFEELDQGTWEARRTERPAPEAVPGFRLVDLHEWTEPKEGKRVYRPADEPGPPGWVQAESPLCRVWVTAGP